MPPVADSYDDRQDNWRIPPKKETPKPKPQVTLQEIMSLVGTIRTCQATGHPDREKHVSNLLDLLEKFRG